MKRFWIFQFILFAFQLSIIGAVRKTASDLPDPPYQHGCRWLFNEHNLYATNLQQFIEIASYCLNTPKINRPSSLSLFKLIFIDHEGYLIGHCKLEGTVAHEPRLSSFYTIGATGTPNLNFNIENCQLTNTNPQDPTKSMFPIGMTHPVGLALLFNEKQKVLESVELSNLNGVYLKKKLSKPLENKIMRNLQDFYLISSGSPYVFCDYFSRFYDGYNINRVGLLRDWQGNPRAQDLSLNRCSNVHFQLITLPFQPELFKYSKPTPGERNACRDGFQYSKNLEPIEKRARTDIAPAVHENCYSPLPNPETDNYGFIENPLVYQNNLERAAMEHLPVDEVELPSPFFRNNDETCPLQNPMIITESDTDSSDSSESDSISNFHLSSPLDRNSNSSPDGSETSGESSSDDSDSSASSVNTSTDEDSVVDNISDFSDEDNDNPNILNPPFRFVSQPIDMQMFEENLAQVPRYIFETCDHQTEDLLQEFRNLNNIDIVEVQKVDTCNWIEISPQNKKFRCKFCNSLLKQDIIFDRPGSNLVTTIMTMGAGRFDGVSRRSINKELLLRHQTNPLHLIAVDYYRLFDHGFRGRILQKKFERINGPFRNFLKTTENMMVASFASAKLGLTFFRFPQLTELLNYYDVETGHIYQNMQGMKTMLMSISEKLHQKLVNHLLTQNKEISIMIDASTDIGAYASLSVLLQTYAEDGKIKVYFYKLLEVTEGERGAQLFDLFLDQIRKDGLEQYFQTKIYGYTSDGAPNVASVFKNKLKNFATNAIVAVHCGCHRIELVNKHAYEDFEFLQSIDIKVNSLVKFFNPKSAKRRIILRAMTLSNKEQRFELKRIRKIRWINSKARSLKNIIIHWKSIVNTLDKISDDETFKFDVRENADTLLDSLLDGTFLITLAFVCDVSFKLSAISVQMQKRGSTLIAKKSMRDTLKSELQLMRTTYGPYILRLLDAAEYDVPDDRGYVGKPLLVDIEKHENIKIDGISLNKPQQLNSGQSLYTNMARYLQALQDQVDNYFHEDPADFLAVLDPAQFPNNIGDYVTYGVAEMTLASAQLQWKERWKIEDADLRQEWTSLAASIFEDEDFVEYKSKLPEEFWAHYLCVRRNVRWTANTRKIISNIITVPCTTAEVERSFSLYSAIKTWRRFNLLPSTVDAMLRIRYNGGELNEFDTLQFTKYFLKSHSRSDDKSRRETWKKTRVQQNMEQEFQNIENELLHDNNEVL